MRSTFPAPPEGIDHDDRSLIDHFYGVARERHRDRPWVGLCMVTSLDGSTTVAGVSGPLGNRNDSAVLGALRRAADVVLVGAGTARLERYGAPAQAGLRIGVISNTGAVDVTTELFTSGAGFLVVPEHCPVADGVEALRAGAELLDIPAALARIGEIVGDVTFVQVEGGPSLNAAFLDGDLVDELDLTVSPHLVGGGGPRVITGAHEAMTDFELAHLLVDDESYAFSRWVRRRAC